MTTPQCSRKGFSLIEVILTLVLLSIVALMAATVMGAGCLRAQQLMTEQGDVRRMTTCMEHIKAIYGERRLFNFPQGIDKIAQCQGLNIKIDAVQTVVTDTKDGKHISVKVNKDWGNLYQVRVSQGKMEFTYVLGS